MINSGTSTPFKNGDAIKIDASLKPIKGFIPTLSYRQFEFPGNEPGIIGHGLEIKGLTFGFRKCIFSFSKIKPYTGISLGYAIDTFQEWKRKPEFEPYSSPDRSYGAIAFQAAIGIDFRIIHGLMIGLCSEYWSSTDGLVSRTNHSEYIRIGYVYE